MKGLGKALIRDYLLQQGCSSEKARDRIISSWPTFCGLLLVDVPLCFIFVGPSVVAFWRCVWDFTYLLAEESKIDMSIYHFISFITGFIVTISIDIFHSCMASNVGVPGSLSHKLAACFFSLIWSIFDIHLWKGVWDGYDYCFGDGVNQSISTFIIGSLVLIMFGALKSALSIPVGLGVDDSETHIACSTYFQTTKQDTILKRMWDASMSRFLEICVVLCWHGIWTGTDIFTQEEEFLNLNKSQSTLWSVVAGTSGIIIIFLWQLPLVKLYHSSEKDVSWCLRIVNILFILCSVFVTVQSFRGFWYSLDLLFLPSHEYLTYTLSGLIGFLCLGCLGCLTSLHAGIFTDNMNSGVSIPFHYLSHKYAQQIQQNQESEKA